MKDSNSPKLVKTNDGSSTLYLEEIDEHYHSTHGALSESEHVFIAQGLNEVNREVTLPSPSSTLEDRA